MNQIKCVFLATDGAAPLGKITLSVSPLPARKGESVEETERRREELARFFAEILTMAIKSSGRKCSKTCGVRMRHIIVAALAVTLAASVAPRPVAARVFAPEPFAPRRAIVVPQEYAPALIYAAGMTGFPIDALARVIEAESGFNPRCVGVNRNGTRDYGIAQLNSEYLEYFALHYNSGYIIDPFDAETGIIIAARYLSALYAETGNMRQAVAAYNCGLSRVRSGVLPMITEDYLRKVGL